MQRLRGRTKLAANWPCFGTAHAPKSTAHARGGPSHPSLGSLGAPVDSIAANHRHAGECCRNRLAPRACVRACASDGARSLRFADAGIREMGKPMRRGLRSPAKMRVLQTAMGLKLTF